ncbi:MAG: glycosyltransferase family 61 protein [Anaerolineae bacterium]|nr:glycosyltransferase family 61 protein [Anaerolineae bacterium]
MQVASPVAANPEIPDGFRKHSIYECPPTYVACLYHGRVATKNLDVISPDDRVFGDLYQPSDGKISTLSLIYPRLPRLKRVPGVYATIVSNRNPHNYYHWMVDYLTRLWPLHESGIINYKVLVPAKLTSFQTQSLQMLGYSEDDLVPFGQEHWEVDHLLVPSFAPAYRFSPQACQWLRTKLISTLNNVEEQCPKKVFVSRQLAAKRRVSNEDEIWNSLLKPAGFVRMYSEKMTLAEQAKLFCGADVVISPHGAGLTNILFMRQNALVVELGPALRGKPEYFLLASAMGVRYACVTNATNDAIRPSGRVPDGDFDIPVERLAATMTLLRLR